MARSRDSHERYREYRTEATEAKHAILEGYLLKLLRILGRKSEAGGTREIHYVDTHAFRGRHDDGSPGSAVIAMRQGEAAHTGMPDAPHVHCHFIEIRADWYEDLKRTVELERQNAPSVDVNTYHGDWRDAVGQVLPQIPNWQPAFFFVDPFGYALPMTEVVGLLKSRLRSELFITLMDQHISQYMSDEPKHEVLDRLFGTTEWRQLLHSRQGERRPDVVDFYLRQLQRHLSEYAGIELPIVYPIRVLQEGAPYTLVHAAQNYKARVEMEAAVRRGKPGGALETVSQGALLTPGAVRDSMREVVKAWPGIVFKELVTRLWQEHPYTPYAQLRDVAAELIEGRHSPRRTRSKAKIGPPKTKRHPPSRRAVGRSADQGGLFG